MAEEFQTGICSAGSWWNTIRTTTFDYGPSIPCTMAIGTNIGDDSPGSGSSITFQDTQKPQLAFMDSTSQLSALGDWTQPFLPYYRQEGAMEIQPDRIQMGFGDSSETQFKDMNHQALLQGQNQQDGFGLPTTMLQGLFEPVDQFPQFLRAGASSSPPPPRQQLHFSNNAPFWNPSATPMPDQFDVPRFGDKLSSNLRMKHNSEGVQEPNSQLITKPSVMKKSGGEPPAKKTRIDMPSPLPTFKVRKEKLGDRITALQQLVSPFGKTDTASVLHEAIEYIKFLHDQVSVLSTPYLKNNGHQVQQQKNLERSKEGGGGPKQDLRSRGLCLVPISSTFAVASEMPLEYWNPTFGGSFR